MKSHWSTSILHNAEGNNYVSVAPHYSRYILNTEWILLAGEVHMSKKCLLSALCWPRAKVQIRPDPALLFHPKSLQESCSASKETRCIFNPL